MMRLSKKMLFAIEAVVDIAYNAGSMPAQSRDITRRQGIPRRYLEQALQHLVRRNILIGVRGPKGGYRLARDRRHITIGDIVRVVRAMEGGDSPVDEAAGSDLGVKVVRPIWTELQDQAMTRLDAVSVEDLCDRAHRSGISREGRPDLEYTA